MNHFLDYCGFRRVKARVDKGRPVSPVSEVYNSFTCSNFACVNHTEEPTQWRKVIYRKAHLYFCSEECYMSWFDYPGLMGSWSPTLKSGTSPEDPPNLQSSL